MHNPFRYFNSSPEVIRLAVMMYVRYPLSLRQVEDLLCERGIDICHETVRYWWNRFGPLFAAEIRKRRVHHRFYSLWRWHLDEVFVRINGKTHYLWRAVDHEGEVVEVFVTKRRDRRAALEFLTRAMKRYGRPASIVTDRLPSYRAAMKVIGNEGCQETGRWLNNRAENWVYPGFPTLFWGLSVFFVGDLMGKALWKLVENAARFPRRGGRVLCVHGAVSFHRARPCGPRWLPGRGAMRHVELDRRVLGLQSTGE